MAEQGRRSLRIERLRRAQAAGGPGAQAAAVDALWAEVAAGGTPLIEPAPDAPGESLITFLHRGDADARNVTLISQLTGFDFAASRFTPLPGADLWYFTTQARDDLRTTYHIAVNDTLAPLADEREMESRYARWRLAPFNPRALTLSADEEIPGDQEYSASIVELPGAAPQPYSAPRPGVPAGQVERFRLSSERLGNERRIWVYTPPGYDPDTREPYALVILFDAPVSLTTIPAPTIADNLIAEGRIPPVILLGIDSLSQESRMRELMCHQPFADFLAHEALPWARARYPITADPARVALAGQSAGGVAAAFVALRYPSLFGAVLSQSGAFWWAPEDATQPNWLIQRFAQSPTAPLRFYLDVGYLETFAGPGARGESILAANRALRDALAAKGYPLTYAESHSGHDYLQWRGTLADGLLALLGQDGR